MTTPTMIPQAAPASVDRDAAIATLVAAFSADPLIRWIYPDATRYLTHFPELVQLMGGQAFDAGTADVADRHVGVALWLAPDVELDGEALGELLVRSTDPDRHEALLELLGKTEEHHPDEPCWYLPFIGVDPSCQGRGHGAAVLRRGLDRCDRDHLPAYLEASSPRNRALYERHGFAVVGEITAEDSPPLWPMLRAAR